ncbi:TadE/TadG family type IV pilus assembly protein [Vibrio misgurnus]|uniref:TadE/TadG family type IV pilus assembly protein n=1 Tax=Vibrio misgurnus TaxID=2993714 RepID=UPI00241672AB|nr:TadE/TadG family type IV pilus assembly protein [Vibrio sp. gvc]
MHTYSRLHHQSGHAAILFSLFIPVLFGIFTLGTDGARAIQDKARLLEAVEVASLAVAGQGSDNVKLAKNYLEYYFPAATIQESDIQIKKINCEDNNRCKDDESRFFEYQVTAKISQPTWFPGNEAVIGFGKDYDIASHSVTRKFHSETVDVILVSDFSASMHNTWKGGSKKKFLDLKDIIVVIADELDSFNGYMADKSLKNKLGVVGFDYYTSRYNNNVRYFYSHLICGNNEKECTKNNPGGSDTSVNYTATVRDVFNLNSIAHTPWQKREVTNVSSFEDVLLTDDMASLKTKINSNSFNITSGSGSGTAFYAGLIRGAQIIHQQGENPRQLIIILSDGVESNKKTTQKLIQAGLCKTIFDKLNSQQHSNGDNVKARIFAVGFDYEVKDNPQLADCVGADNVFQAQNRDDIKNKILELITEEIGHLSQ